MRQNPGTANALATMMYEERLKLPQRDPLDDAAMKQRFGENMGQLLDPNHASILKSAAAAGQASGQVLHGAAGAMSPQIQSWNPQLPGSTPDIKTEMNPVLNPRAAGPEGSLIGIPGSNQGGNNLTLKGWPLTEFDFRGHDSAFKDRYLQLQNVRVSFIPTDKRDIHDLGPMEEVVSNLVRHVYSAPTQMANVFDMQERTIDGKNYYTFEYALTSPNFSRAAFATIAIGNGRYYTLIVGANERRWRRVRNQLKVVADSFKVLDI